MGAETGDTGVPEDAEDPRRRFAEECRSARELYPGKPLTQTELARMTRTSKSTISRVERCDGPIPPALPARLDQVLGTDGKFKRLYEESVASSFPTLYRRRMALERAAVAIREWSPTIVPGLFQTARYARCLVKGGSPLAGDDEVAAFVANRLLRQAIYESETPPDVRLVLCESVLRRRFCPPDVMREQLQALVTAGERPTVRVQILPLDAPAHLFVDWPVTLLTSPNQAVAACVENYQTAGIVEDSAYVQAALRTYDALTSDALSPRESARLIAEQMEALS
ncbi:DNA-binding protein [Streptomyces sp. NHF165]|uniref:helix-turn-helix domain-containing protein n=1 Tax=Streptomyces sp. NHF165 TaxID=2175864 RepID=UPI00132EAB87|nr:helix-turn-helix transcriptional regulator [Streptomyces sp. NHF165]QHF93390.1 DNA-binding protein [Streptomyces sp. NHF165]